MSRRITGFSPAELSCFCSEVALMLSSGLPLYDGMEGLAQTYLGTQHEQKYTSVSRLLNESGSLYHALKSDEFWPVYLTEMVGIGERTGRLEEVMKSLSVFYEREGRLKQTVRSAITYPIVLSVMLILIVLIMIMKVLPVFRRVMTGMGVALNDSGQTMTAIGTTLGWCALAFIGFILIATIVVLILLSTSKREKVLSWLRNSFPPIRKLSEKLASSRVAAVLSMMFCGGYPLNEALHIVPSVLTDSYIIDKVKVMEKKVDNGEAFGTALNDSGLFDEMYNRMIQTGLNSGHQDEVMAKVAEIYEDQVETGISNLVSIIEPSLIAILSIVIGAILLAVMMPMAGVITSIM